MQIEEIITSNKAKIDNKDSLLKETDYEIILQYYHLEYKRSDYYLQVGDIKHIQGWILHLSIVTYQITELFHKIIPILINENISFKIPLNKETAQFLIHGHFGNPQLGKIISIYPDNDIQALSVAQKLIKATREFKAPRILTDIHLGGVVYTRYGGCNPIIQTDIEGKKDKYIYNTKGQLVKDPYSIPFKLDKGIIWPFATLTNPVPPGSKKTLNKLYKLTSILKGDARGNVYKGIYIKGLFRVSDCVIKQGKKHMYSEDTGRDIYDRLLWQYQLQKELEGIIPLPKAYDFFTEDEDCYLAMEYIEAISFFERIKQLNPLLKAWFQLPYELQSTMLHYLIQILSIVEKLHQKGYIHRDIQPANFLINSEEQVIMIDIELAWSIENNQPTPPFELGTPGFMAPEQEMGQTPTVKADIYSIGAMIATLLTGLSPVKFNISDKTSLEENLYFFIQNRPIAGIISKCLSYKPIERPELSDISSALYSYKKELENTSIADNLQPDLKNIDTLLSTALTGIASPPIVMLDNIWYSKEQKKDNRGTPQHKEYTRYGGLYEGVGGAMYVLARASRAGYPINNCRLSYDKSWQYLKDNYFPDLQNMNGGLYRGAAGVAIVIKEGLHAGLLENNEMTRQRLQECITLVSTGLDVASGAAGNGIALLSCADYLPEKLLLSQLQKNITILLNAQQKDGSWITGESSKYKSIGFANGTSGIVWFLLSYTGKYKDLEVMKAAIKALDWLKNITNNLKDIFNPDLSKKIIVPHQETGDERTGIISTFIKAYEILKDDYYRLLAENALYNYSDRIVTNNLSTDTGLAGLGEVYMEASQVLGANIWKERAQWIASVIDHIVYKKSNSYCYWKMEENNEPTADLMTGNSGIIHFLLRIQSPQIGYRLLT